MTLSIQQVTCQVRCLPDKQVSNEHLRTLVDDVPRSHKVHEPDGSSHQEIVRCIKQSPLQAQKFEKVLANGLGLDIISISLTDPSQEMDGVGVAQVPLECLEHILLHLEDITTQVYLLLYNYTCLLTFNSEVHFALSSSLVFSCTDKICDSEHFYNSLLELLYDPEEQKEVEELLSWWNR